MRFVASLAGIVLLAAAGCDRPPVPKPAPVVPAAVTPAVPSWTPREAWEARRSAWLAGDAATVWGSLGSASRAAKVAAQEKAMEDMKRLPDDALAKALIPYGLTAGAFCRMTGEEFCLHMIKRVSKDPAARKVFEGQEFVDATMVDGRAVCRIGSHTGNAEYVVFSVEGGDWKVDESETSRMNGRAPSK